MVFATRKLQIDLTVVNFVLQHKLVKDLKMSYTFDLKVVNIVLQHKLVKDLKMSYTFD